MQLKYIFSAPWINVYEDDPADTAIETKPEDTDPKKIETDDKSVGDDEKPKFTQKQLNAMLAEHKRGLQSQVTAQVKELEVLKKSKNLSDTEREKLSARIEELNNSLLSKQELAAKERDALEKKHKVAIEETGSQRDYFKKLFETTTIEHEIVKEATKADAFNASQIITLLKGSTRLVEVMDDQGNVVPEKYSVKIKLDDVDKDGKPVTLDLTVPEAIKRMKERPEDYGNLFKANLAGGLGENGGKSRKEFDPKKATPEQFREWRKTRGY
jgi:hypothetical protein